MVKEIASQADSAIVLSGIALCWNDKVACSDVEVSMVVEIITDNTGQTMGGTDDEIPAAFSFPFLSACIIMIE